MDKIICLVCEESIEKEELKGVASEFKPYPAHSECFDSFINADEFLEFAKNKSREILSSV